jgi:transposase
LAAGHEVVVANPRQLRLITHSSTKTDRNDAEMLARLGRADPELLKPVAHRRKEAQADLADELSLRGGVEFSSQQPDLG